MRIPLILLGLSLRLLAHKYASKEFVESFTYSPMDQWDSLLEGIYLTERNMSAYDNNLVHQPPLVLHVWSRLLPLLSGRETLLFLFLELIMIGSLLNLSLVCISTILETEKYRQSVNESSRGMLLSRSHFDLAPTLVLICYSVNPYSIVSFAAQSTSIVWNIVGVWSLIACFSGHLIMASCLCAVGCYLRFYPGYMLLPILITPFALPAATGLPSRLLRATASLLGFALTLAGLFWASYILENGQWLFLNSVYLYQFTFADCTAQLGIYWYMFVEMFEHFQDLFVWVFQLLLPVLVVALSLRFYYDPLYLSYLVAFLINVLQPYHSVGEFGYLIALLPLWSHLVKTARMRLITPCVLLSALVLTPLFRYMWLQPGTANANFYFSACMVYAVGQNLLFADLLNAYSKREYILRVGPSFKLKSGQELVLSHA